MSVEKFSKSWQVLTMSQNLKLDQQLCFALYGASMAINRAYKPFLDELGITYTQYLVLAALQETGEQTIGDVAAGLHLEPSTLTPLVKRLETAGLLSRSRNPDDERQVRIRLTEQGHHVRQRCSVLTSVLATSSAMADDELVQLNSAIQRFRDSVADYLTRG